MQVQPNEEFLEPHGSFRCRPARISALARVACAALIEDLVRRGLVPVWSCREDNTGSARLAGSLGFAVSRWLPYYEVRATLVR